MKKTFYEILEVSASASAEIIGMTYQSLLKKYLEMESRGDPDAANKLKFLTIAYKVISDPAQRSLYDSRLALAAIPPQSAAISIPTHSTIDGVRGGIGLGKLINFRHPVVALLMGILIVGALFTAYSKFRSTSGTAKTASSQSVAEQTAKQPKTSPPENKDETQQPAATAEPMPVENAELSASERDSLLLALKERLAKEKEQTEQAQRLQIPNNISRSNTEKSVNPKPLPVEQYTPPPTSQPVPSNESRQLTALVKEALDSGDIVRANDLAVTSEHWAMIAERQRVVAASQAAASAPKPNPYPACRAVNKSDCPESRWKCIQEQPAGGWVPCPEDRTRGEPAGPSKYRVR